MCSLLFLLLPLFSLSGQSFSLSDNYITVSNIQASVNDNNIIISWHKAKNSFDLRYQLYQHTKPITKTNFREATAIAFLGPGIQQFDLPLGYNMALWFAVLSVRKGEVVPMVLPGQNSTLAGITTSVNPYSDKQTGPNFNNPLSGSSTLSAPSITDILPEDTRPATGENHSRLIDIVKKYLWIGKWEIAKAELFILKAKGQLNDWEEARTVFYLAQCDYYLGNLKDSYLSFFVSSTLYPVESNSWIKRISTEIASTGAKPIFPFLQDLGNN